MDDPELAELKEEVKELKLLVEDTNRGVRKMRRSQRMHTLFTIGWWLTVVGVTGAAYYYYIQPYVERAVTTYQQVQDGAQQARNWQEQAQEFLSKYFKQGTTTQ